MSGITRGRATTMLLLGFAILQVPAPLHAQTAEERARQEEMQRRMEQIEAAQQERIAQLEHLHQERLVRMEETLARMRAQLAEEEFRQQEMSQAQLQEMEKALAEAKAHREHALQSRDEAIAQEFVAQRAILEKQFAAQSEARAEVEHARERYAQEFALQAEARARAHALQTEEARLHRAEAAALYREQAREAREVGREAREQARMEFLKAQQVMVRVKARVRLGVQLDGNQAPEFDERGARVQGVMEDTPAEDAGLLEGDIITHLNGQSLLSPIPGEADEEFDEEESLPVQRLMALAQELDAGDEVVLGFSRDGSSETVTFEAAEIDEPSIAIYRGEGGEVGKVRVLRVHPEGKGIVHLTLSDDEAYELDLETLEGLEELEELEIELKELEALKDLQVDLKGLHVGAPNLHIRSLPESNVRAFTYGSGDSPYVYSVMRGAGRFGLELAEMNPGLSEYFSSDNGLLVLNVDEDSTLGVLPGDVILSVDGRAVEDQADLFRILRSYEEDEAVTFTVVRKGQQMSVEGKAE